MKKLAAWTTCALVLGLLAAPSVRASDPEAEAVEFGPGIEAPKLLNSIRATYPAAAKDDGIAGTVVIRALIDRNGRVKKTEIVSSPDKHLAKAALAAMTMREYAPARRDGEPIAVWVTESFEFRQSADEVATILACDPTKVDSGEPPIGADFDLPVIVRNVDPAVSDDMKLRREPGRVVLKCKLDVCGRVSGCAVLQSNGAEFSRSAISAAEKRLYHPATKNGKPVAIDFTLRFDFHF